MFNNNKRVVFFAVLAFLLLCVLFSKREELRIVEVKIEEVLIRPDHWGLPNGVDGEGNWAKPEAWIITGVIFFGRKDKVEILDCYLRKNLHVNGGYLDNVIFIQNTDKVSDLEYLDQLLEEVPEYSRQEIPQVGNPLKGFSNLWDTLQDPDTIYIKIDDDVVWMQDHAIPQIVHTLLENPDAYAIGGNMINNPSASFWHHHTGATRAYLPDPDDNAGANHDPDWRPSKLPQHPGAEGDWNFDPESSPAFDGQRWLPLRNTSEELMKTPLAGAKWDDGRAWWSWAVAAQQHYSLFENLEQGRLREYVFGLRPINLHFDRYNINFVAIKGSTVALQLPGKDDEGDITVNIPKALNKYFLIDTKALVAHFAFYPQQKEMMRTDILRRYRAYANEFVCKKSLDLN